MSGMPNSQKNKELHQMPIIHYLLILKGIVFLHSGIYEEENAVHLQIKILHLHTKYKYQHTKCMQRGHSLR